MAEGLDEEDEGRAVSEAVGLFVRVLLVVP